MKKNWYRNFLTMLALLALGRLFFFPLYWTFMTSLKTTAQIFVEKPIFFTKEFYTGNYAEIFQKSHVAQFFINSIIVAGCTTFISLVLATMAGFGFNRYNFKMKAILQNSALIVRMIPALVYTIPYYIIYSKLHLLDTLLGLILAYISFALPLAIWLAINFFAEIPKEVYESAEMDGCSEYKLYWYIAVPLVKAGMVVIAILVFIGAWNEFGLALVL